MDQVFFSNIKAIKEFFESGDHGRKVTMEEIKALSQADRVELGQMCNDALNAQ